MSKFTCVATWDDVPHLTKEQRDELWASLPPHERDARTRGIPQQGSGSIYPISVQEITVDPFPIPAHWPRAYGLDVGWNWTAAIWMAWNQEEDVAYLYSEYKQGKLEPAVHAEAIKSRGEWMWGVIDPASQARSQADGQRLIDQYRLLRLNLSIADNAREGGILAVWKRLSEGRLKVFSNLNKWFHEFRMYHRDDTGKIVKKEDHLMDATRYLILSGFDVIASEPTIEDMRSAMHHDTRSSTTGY